jgi:hypothetical protein
MTPDGTLVSPRSYSPVGGCERDAKVCVAFGAPFDVDGFVAMEDVGG